MSGGAAGAQHRQQELYWRQMVELKALAVFARLHRDRQGAWVKRIGIVKGVAASSTLPGWIFFQRYVYVWGLIVAAAQVLDAVRDYVPHARSHRAAAELTTALEMLFIDAQDDWEDIFAGRVPDREIAARRRRLARAQLAAERKFFPSGIAPDAGLARLADREANAYFQRVYGVGDSDGGSA